MSEATAAAAADRRPRPVDYDRAVKLGGAISRFKARAASEKERADAAEKQLKSLTEENASLKTRADSSLASKRVEELTSELRGLKHRQAFDKLATSKGVRPEGLDDLWRLSEYRPETDLVDETALGVLIDDQKTKRGYLFGESKAAEGRPPPPPKPGPGGGQGATDAGPQRFTADQMNDPAFVMRNYGRIAEAAKAAVDSGRA